MMKKNKLFAVLIVAVMCLGLVACGMNGGKIDENIKLLAAEPSELFNETDIAAAIDATEAYFKKEFSGCTLTSIGYAGDETSIAHSEWAERIDADETIVLVSSFDVDSSGGDGSLNPNSTYNNWMWILARKDNGNWEHVDHGY